MYIYSKSLKENVVILKTHFVLVVTSEKVSGGIIVERGKQLAMLHFQSWMMNTQLFISLPLYFGDIYYIIVIIVKADRRVKQGQILHSAAEIISLSYLFIPLSECPAVYTRC